jgi:hypothetical protein
MFRIRTSSVAFIALVSVGMFPALAQSAPAKLKSPGEIAAASRLLAKKMRAAGCKPSNKD